MTTGDQVVRAKQLGLRALHRTPLRRLVLHRYRYMFSPAQLAFLVQALDDAVKADGAVVEVGCAYGHTTVFLNRHLDDVAPERAYWAIDTFAGFVAEDVALEHQRGRRSRFDTFGTNSRRWFEDTMALNGIRRVRVEQADANRFAFDRIGPVAFGLVDVDLYRPVLSTLDALWEQLTPGGTLVVDDCDPDHPGFRGAWEAYHEFVDRVGLPARIELGKLGVITRG